MAATGQHRRTRDLQRDAYLVSRTLGDINAAQRGRLGKRLVRRVVHRKIIGLLRRARVW
jgi:hypothetical protein